MQSESPNAAVAASFNPQTDSAFIEDALAVLQSFWSDEEAQERVRLSQLPSKYPHAPSLATYN